MPQLLLRILPLICSFVAAFFGRFLGSEGSAIMTTPYFLLLVFVLLLCLIRLHLYGSKRKKNLILDYVILFLLGFVSYLLRFYVVNNIFTIFVASVSMMSGNGGNSGWTSILGQEEGSGSSGGNSGWTSVLGQGDGSASSVNQPTPTNSTQTGSASETGVNVIPVELQQKREELHLLVFRQYMHFMHRDLKSWQVNTSAEWIELSHVCVRNLINSLEIEDSVFEYERWISHLRANPTTLHPIFKDYKK